MRKLILSFALVATALPLTRASPWFGPTPKGDCNA